jgi:general secretion pathway protein D
VVDEFAVKVVPAGSVSDSLRTRTFRVPPDFLSSLSSGVSTGGDQAADPFAEAVDGGGLLTQRLSAQEALARNGVAFPDGASASFSAATSSLIVTNTALNLDLVDQIVEAMSKSEPVAVSVKVTMIRTQQTNLEELGFDWLVNPFPLNAGNDLFAGGGTTGNGTPRTGADMVSPVGGTSVDGIPADPNATATQGLVTNGLRSGDAAISQNAIDSLVNNFDRTSQGSAVAPGVMAVTGLFSDAQVQALMRGLDQKKGTDMLAQPATVTRSGQASKVEVIREFIYPTEYEPPELPNQAGSTGSGGGFPVTPATPTAFETRDVGISLEVLPVADANRRYVDITLNPSFSDFDGFVNYGSPINANGTDALGNPVTTRVTDNRILMPIFSSQRAATQLTVADGATVVIGTLLTDRIQNVEDEVPIFGSIPVIGRMFQSTARQKVSTALIMMVKVELLDPTGRPYRDR